MDPARDARSCAARPWIQCDTRTDVACKRCEGPAGFMRLRDGACELCAQEAWRTIFGALERLARDPEHRPWCSHCRELLAVGAPRRVVWSCGGLSGGSLPGALQVLCASCAQRAGGVIP